MYSDSQEFIKSSTWKSFFGICMASVICERQWIKIRLTSIAILSIERDTSNDSNFEDIINDFATLKARRTIC